jgi:hypothetical protein
LDPIDERGCADQAGGTTMSDRFWDEVAPLQAAGRLEVSAYDGIIGAGPAIAGLESAGAEVDVLASRANLSSNAYAVAGCPAITVPDGPLSDLSGLTLIGPYLSDGGPIGSPSPSSRRRRR